MKTQKKRKGKKPQNRPKLRKKRGLKQNEAVITPAGLLARMFLMLVGALLFIAVCEWVGFADVEQKTIISLQDYSQAKEGGQANE